MLYNLIGTELVCLYYKEVAMSTFSSVPKPEIVISMHRAKGELDQENPKEQITIRVRNSLRLGDKETTGDRQGFVFSVREDEGRPVELTIAGDRLSPKCLQFRHKIAYLRAVKHSKKPQGGSWIE
jgi:hypothetical protein